MIARRSLLRLLAAAPLCGLAGSASAQKQFQPPRLGRYRVYIDGVAQRILEIDSAATYAVHEILSGELYGRGSYTYDGTYARFPTGPFYTLGWWGESFVRPDGRHSIRLSRFVEAISEP